MVARAVVAGSALVAVGMAARKVDPKPTVKWGIRYGLTGAAMKAAARKGDAFARLTYDPALHDDPYPFYEEIRATAPVLPGVFAMVSARYDVVSHLIRGGGFMSGFPDEALPRPLRAAMAWAEDPAAQSPIDRPSMVMSNGEIHTRHRRLVSKAFTARAVENLTTRVEEITSELLDQLERDERAGTPTEIATQYASILPILVIAEILGVPADHTQTFLGWGRAIAPVTELGLSYATFRRADTATRELNAWLVGHFARLRENPTEALLSRILTAAAEETKAGGVGLSDADLVAISNLLLFAGFETTVHLISHGVVQLLAHPDQLAALRADPAGWRNAIEEILRYEAPLQNSARYSAEDTEVFGVPVPAGKLVAVLYAGANRDPAVFENPNAFDVYRTNAREHLSFAHGGHFCVGAALARLEGDIALRMLFERFPNMAAAGTARRRPTRNLRGYDSIPVHLGVPARTFATSTQHAGTSG